MVLCQKVVGIARQEAVQAMPAFMDGDELVFVSGVAENPHPRLVQIRIVFDQLGARVDGEGFRLPGAVRFVIDAIGGARAALHHAERPVQAQERLAHIEAVAPGPLHLAGADLPHRVVGGGDDDGLIQCAGITRNMIFLWDKKRVWDMMRRLMIFPCAKWVITSTESQTLCQAI